MGSHGFLWTGTPGMFRLNDSPTHYFSFHTMCGPSILYILIKRLYFVFSHAHIQNDASQNPSRVLPSYGRSHSMAPSTNIKSDPKKFGRSGSSHELSPRYDGPSKPDTDSKSNQSPYSYGHSMLQPSESFTMQRKKFESLNRVQEMESKLLGSSSHGNHSVSDRGFPCLSSKGSYMFAISTC